ncbi:hypothetical protein [Shinella sp. HZN7]|uniref:hypothetical protein n=1 Tax=Shinella sp. (strain HZN7) TaxID=879274 RepID=UPI0007DAA2A7|nr:hypothetical protein [Shinella sp. HZN7]ANH08560.1 hypothetical protein shn_30905 [Shinella sp. HZN7]
MEMERAEMERGGLTAMHDTEFATALAAEIARLKAQGYSKAYICERSFDIEDAVQRRVARTAQQGDFS